MKTKLILAALVLAVSTAPAFAADTGNSNANSNVCLMHRDVDGWGARDDHSMVVNDRFGRKYLVNLAGVCDDIDFAFGAGFRSLGGNFPGSCVERGDHLILRGGGVSFPHSTCWVTKVQPYTQQMQDADKVARANHQKLTAY
jgi:hypothetical protein